MGNKDYYTMQEVADMSAEYKESIAELEVLNEKYLDFRDQAADRINNFDPIREAAQAVVDTADRYSQDTGYLHDAIERLDEVLQEGK